MTENDDKAVKYVCGCCDGSGWVVRDPDIGTDQECYFCDGTGELDEDQ